MFVIVRHGNTFESGEMPRRIGAATDLPLTRRGWEQGEALGRCFADRGWNFARMLVSPLLRTRQTAEAIARHQREQPAIETDLCLREIDHGPDEGQSEPDVIARIGQQALENWDRLGIAPAGWRVARDERLLAWRKLLAQVGHEAGPMLAVTSNGAARFALLADEHLSRRASELPSLKLATGAFGVIARNAAGALEIVSWNERP